MFRAAGIGARPPQAHFRLGRLEVDEIQVPARREFIAVVHDRPADLDVDPVGPIEPATRALMQRVKERFDPAGVCI